MLSYSGYMRKILFGVLFLLAAGAAQARVLEGRIIEVLDGDTVTVLSNGTSTHRIRLLGIDAPERGQPHGDLAREHLRRLVRGKAVRVEWERMDDYGRIVGVLLISESAQRCRHKCALGAYCFRSLHFPHIVCLIAYVSSCVKGARLVA